MIWLSFDTETTGIDAPRLVELGAVLMEDERERACVSLIVRPGDYDEIPEAAARVHGITTVTALACGVPLIVAIYALTNLWAAAWVRVAHNLEFDDKVIAAAMASLGRISTLPRPPGVCTKELAAPILNLPPTERLDMTSPNHRACARCTSTSLARTHPEPIQLWPTRAPRLGFIWLS